MSPHELPTYPFLKLELETGLRLGFGLGEEWVGGSLLRNFHRSISSYFPAVKRKKARKIF